MKTEFAIYIETLRQRVHQKLISFQEHEALGLTIEARVLRAEAKILMDVTEELIKYV